MVREREESMFTAGTFAAPDVTNRANLKALRALGGDWKELPRIKLRNFRRLIRDNNTESEEDEEEVKETEMEEDDEEAILQNEKDSVEDENVVVVAVEDKENLLEQTKDITGATDE